VEKLPCEGMRVKLASAVEKYGKQSEKINRINAHVALMRQYLQFQ
jgi:hypothetical protein